jgi:hypothetical protein
VGPVSNRSIALHLQRLVRVAFQDVDLYSPPERSDEDGATAARHLSELESLLLDRLVAMLPPTAKADHAAIADLLGGVRHEYVRLLEQRIGARLGEPHFSSATWGCTRTEAGARIVGDPSWEDRKARVVLQRVERRAEASFAGGTTGGEGSLTDGEVLALAGDRLVLEFRPR